MSKRVRFAVVGLGHIAQIAVLPAFKNAEEKCELTGFISDSPEKIKELSEQYKVSNSWSYSEYGEALKSGKFDAVYIALPNDQHKEYVIKAAEAGVHVLCEKPMAMNSSEAREMIEAAKANKTKLMIAYRLHFEKANMTAVDWIKEGKIGTPRVFNTSFTMQVREGNIRTQSEHGGGPLMDIGIYCINASRYLFQEEPIEVIAMAAKSSDPRFADVEESVSAVLKYPNEKLATFACSFGAADTGRYEVIGTEGSVTLDPSYEYAMPLQFKLKNKDGEQLNTIEKHDQFAPELLHLAECILENKEPRPSGLEGLNDMVIIDAIKESIESGREVQIKSVSGSASRPDSELIEEKPGVEKPKLIAVEAPSK